MKVFDGRGITALVLFLVVAGCTSAPETQALPVSREEQVAMHLDSLKKTAAAGDLVVRLGDDVLSYQIKNMNDQDKAWSHAGVIVENGGVKMVAHIAPDGDNKDVIRYIPIDSFLVPDKNIECALYRYNFSEEEKKTFIQVIDSMKTSGIHFDWMYDLHSNDKMYCSEMIAKALSIATVNRIQCKTISIPPHMLPLLVNYFKGKASREQIAARKIMTIDNLYRKPECTQLMKFRLKYLPGE